MSPDSHAELRIRHPEEQGGRRSSLIGFRRLVSPCLISQSKRALGHMALMNGTAQSHARAYF
jgi:hypothetical protein